MRPCSLHMAVLSWVRGLRLRWAVWSGCLSSRCGHAEHVGFLCTGDLDWGLESSLINVK
ncbi:hypothetical protein HBI56_237460 [Parastagonospora nodorum]|uniref:Secreted protein n=1 Tax=Phaeosphaeria nodorum (strain SN15 / ATCC MYA-4574 / FGSC 10173) TaxID=321614 RepID=A0A7U2F1J3_PHANO|nr:hypothetical protein HBH56_243710 [Parastagonospora nodorum]QRC96985.1 hypothetical protein JI435_409910 [Parastagonospora nodorum SN15]KAH3924032.1 hypothetical protein HBH54_198590 [Parastagonospora nodorum]KAH3944687.1 hypothetical protein HBH53_155100 [Parastagonospora nodorum]KAH3956573.1 hypothetical protein HBH51_239530 [Parastagonospora nodorum]